VLSQTLQVVRKPVLVLREMLRVGKRGVISFPNFAHWRVRGYLALRGRMPVSRSIPYNWYDTPNIHHTTIKDFRDFVTANGAVVERELPLAATASGGIREVRVLPDLLADSAVFVVRAADSRPSLLKRDTAPSCCGHNVELEKSMYAHSNGA
ncbi:MAG TPA: methionine biosynthesis protein MetW, partial [Coriobacteriia bacterium]